MDSKVADGWFSILYWINIPRGRSANGTRGPMRGTPPIKHSTYSTYKQKDACKHADVQTKMRKLKSLSKNILTARRFD